MGYYTKLVNDIIFPRSQSITLYNADTGKAMGYIEPKVLVSLLQAVGDDHHAL